MAERSALTSPRPSMVLPAGARGLLILILSLALSACDSRTEPARSPTPTGTAPGATAASHTPSPPPPTPTSSPTPVPLAAIVNGEPIPLAVFEAHRARLESAWSELGREFQAEEAAQLALDDLIDQRLLAQAAAENGFQVEEDSLEARLDELREEAGGESALAEWQRAHGYTPEDLRRDLALNMAATWMKDQITGAVPVTAEQVHARQILLFDRDSAENVAARLQAGADFEALARTYDPQGWGDLGWFPEGYLIEPVIEAAAFELAPGEVSPILETRLGYHLIQVIEREAERPLDHEARLTLQIRALEAWLVERRAQSEIEILWPEPT